MENNTISAFALSPMAVRVRLSQGDVYTGQLKITNPVNSTETLHYKIALTPYSDLGMEEGVDFSEDSVYGRILEWITIDNPEGYIEPNETVIVNYTINVPADAKDGGQYCAIAVQNVPEKVVSGNGVNISDVIELVHLIYARVGNVTYGGEILNSTMPTFSLNSDISNVVTVQNTGNAHQDVQIVTNIYSAFTGEQIYLNLTEEEKELLEIGSEEGINRDSDYYSEIVMPETSKTISHTLSGMPVLGVYNVKQEVIFSGETKFLDQQLVICPIWFVVLLFVLLAGVVVGVSLLLKKIFKRKRNVI